VPLPAVITTIPPRPAVVAPLPISMAPLLPDTDVPELNTSMPLTPDVPELIERIVIAPLDADVPSPDARCTAPPVCTVLRPASASNTPPTPDVPLPTVSEIMPARSEVTALEPSMSAPLLPLTDVPELNTKAPLTPDVPEFALRIVTTPLDVDVPSPLATPTAPPVCTVLRPDDV
jgi:hypothetical protein